MPDCDKSARLKHLKSQNLKAEAQSQQQQQPPSTEPIVAAIEPDSKLSTPKQNSTATARGFSEEELKEILEEMHELISNGAIDAVNDVTVMNPTRNIWTIDEYNAELRKL